MTHIVRMKMIEEDRKLEEEKKTPETEEAVEEPGTLEEKPDQTCEASYEAPDPAEEEADSTGKERHFFKKKEKKKDERDEKIETLTDQYKRLMAEFDNFRKRTDKEKSQMFDMGVASVLEKILPVVDNFERGIQTVPEEKREDAAYVGMKLIYEQLLKTLHDAGVEQIEAEGQEFDPNLHNAVMQVENEELKPGTVAAELQKGYLYKGNVIRHSMVSVVQE